MLWAIKNVNNSWLSQSEFWKVVEMFFLLVEGLRELLIFYVFPNGKVIYVYI